jgi:hypothetical protein
VSKRTARNNRRPKPLGNPVVASVQMLVAFRLLNYRMYAGTVPAAVKAKRRAANKVAKQSRKVNRGS